VLPAGIYVLVAAMGASVLTRNRNVLLRAPAPLVVGIAAANYLLPETSHNVGQLVWRWEQRFPALADAHTRTQERVGRFVRTGLEHSRQVPDLISEKVGEVREGIEGWVRKGK
jgi:MICOS complex subunit MIC26